jgi:hypothetical protein
MTPSQTESPSAPEAIENQRSHGGPYGTLSLFRDTHSKQSAHSAALDERLNPCHRLSHRSWKPRPPMMPHLRKGGWGWFRSHVA